MAETIIDSTIVIDALNNHPRSLQYIDDLLSRKEALVHAMTVAEVISVTRDSREQAKLAKSLRRYSLRHGNELDSEAALAFLLKFHLSHDLGFGDCLIGATALRVNLPVATLNDRHFRLFRGLKVIRPY